MAIQNLSLPNVPHAKLPAVYSNAKNAISQCVRIDECKDWADKAEALASYARQSEDDELRNMADRIQARAVRRCGELLQEIKAAQGLRTDKAKLSAGAPTKSPKAEAASSAGMSKHQAVTAVRVANVPKVEFEKSVESDNPPTVTALAEKGKRKAVAKPEPPKKSSEHLKGRSPLEFSKATHVLGRFREFAKFLKENEPDVIIRGSFDYEHRDLLSNANNVVQWAERLIVLLKENLK